MTQEFEKTDIDKALAENIIEQAQTEWAAPVVYVSKKDKNLLFCVDYRKQNLASKRDSYPIRRVHECNASLGKATIFSALDARSGYWQVKFEDADEQKTVHKSQQSYIASSA